jgi:hypothetical protein
VLKIH